MRALPWIIAGVGIGAGITILLLNAPDQEYATGYDSVEDAAGNTFGWGTKNRVKGTVRSVAGAVKEGVGSLTGNDRMAQEGSAQRAAGDIQDAAGTVGHALGQTIHDLNR